jgi:hypothetical protein
LQVRFHATDRLIDTRLRIFVFVLGAASVSCAQLVAIIHLIALFRLAHRVALRGVMDLAVRAPRLLDFAWKKALPRRYQPCDSTTHPIARRLVVFPCLRLLDCLLLASYFNTCRVSRMVSDRWYTPDCDGSSNTALCAAGHAKSDDVEGR